MHCMHYCIHLLRIIQLSKWQCLVSFKTRQFHTYPHVVAAAVYSAGTLALQCPVQVLYNKLCFD